MPEFDPTNSPTTAPTTANVTDTLSPAKIDGSACGRVMRTNVASPRCLHRTGKVEHVGIDRFESHNRRHDDRKKSEHERADDLGDDAEAEPDDEQRRNRNLRHA